MNPGINLDIITHLRVSNFQRTERIQDRADAATVFLIIPYLSVVLCEGISYSVRSSVWRGMGELTLTLSIRPFHFRADRTTPRRDLLRDREVIKVLAEWLSNRQAPHLLRCKSHMHPYIVRFTHDSRRKRLLASDSAPGFQRFAKPIGFRLAINYWQTIFYHRIGRKHKKNFPKIPLGMFQKNNATLSCKVMDSPQTRLATPSKITTYADMWGSCFYTKYHPIRISPSRAWPSIT